jgi:hypothetical protein
MHGSELSVKEWEKRLNKVEEEGRNTLRSNVNYIS